MSCKSENEVHELVCCDVTRTGAACALFFFLNDVASLVKIAVPGGPQTAQHDSV